MFPPGRRRLRSTHKHDLDVDDDRSGFRADTSRRLVRSWSFTDDPDASTLVLHTETASRALPARLLLAAEPLPTAPGAPRFPVDEAQ